MPESDIEVTRLGPIGGRLGLAIAAAALLVAAAVIKPWPVPGPTASPPATGVRSPAAAAVPSAPTASDDGQAGVLCQGTDGWLIVADDVEFGRVVRTWMISDVEYSPGPPSDSEIPVVVLVSESVERIGLCLPAGLNTAHPGGWQGALWRETLTPGVAAGWQLAAIWMPAAGAGGALASAGAAKPPAYWPPGLYALEADVAGSSSAAWLGLLIEASGP